jgi:hydrogenase maturation protein HypF
MMFQVSSIAPQTRLVERLRVTVRGRVQGVGFRPFVHSLAATYGLNGWVRNNCEGVVLEIEGSACQAFLHDLEARPPELAYIEDIEIDRLRPIGSSSFEILKSTSDQASATMIGPDAATCDACLAELFDPADRRYRYPFINCTHCGPRYTITEALPYDRPNTSMAGFEMCAACAHEYTDPADRRFHAQPVACPECGPQLSEPIEHIVEQLRGGEIVAIKGLGGYHLACDATNPSVVERLRARKDREAKPFAVMLAGVSSARHFADIDAADERSLHDRGRPIVVLKRRAHTPLAKAVAPDLSTIGIMLPYTPLHFLLFHEAAGRPAGIEWLENNPPDLTLVMTSANPGGEPLITDDVEAQDRLADIADMIVSHDRGIVVRADDTVVHGGTSPPLVIRRGRGMAPDPITLGRPVPAVLAVGGHLKAAVCVTRTDQAFLSQHIGDLDSSSARRFFFETVDHMLSILDVRPQAVVHDMHPDFYTTHYAKGYGVPSIAVQHHHAHIASVAAEHGRTDRMLGLALDGMGYGPDGSIWGGELLLIEGAGFQRMGHLRQLPQPGNDIAAHEPWRMAAAALHALERDREIKLRFGAFAAAEGVRKVLNSQAPMIKTSSLGRWFDAAAALLGVVPVAAYEGHAAMALESLVHTPRSIADSWICLPDGTLDLLPLLERLSHLDPQAGADAWHGTVAAALAEWAERTAMGLGIGTIALAGGCLLNGVLRDLLVADLTQRGFEVLLPIYASPGDGGISLGQAWVAAQIVGGE